MLVFMALVPVIGMLAAMFLFAAGLGWLWGERRFGFLISTSLFLSAAIWAVFAKGFRVPLPGGLF